VVFNGSGSYDPEGTIVSYAWDFGDSTTATGVTTSHRYLSPGTFNVTLTVTDNGSYTATAYRHIVVQGTSGPAAGIEFWPWVVLVAAVVAAVLLLWWMVRRRRRELLPRPPLQ